jgi:hypothetical protein
MRQTFFETPDVRALQGRPWTPLRQATDYSLPPPDEGVLSVDDFVGIATLAVYEAKRNAADALGWSDLSLREHRSGVESTGYHPADLFIGRSDEVIGVNLVIDQFLEQERRHVWHLHPDIVVALKLLREGDTWFRPEEGWTEVARLRRDEEGVPHLLEIRSEFLSDYLVARGMALYASSYYERTALMAAKPDFDWADDGFKAESGRDKREARVAQVDYGDDRGLFRVMGALWRTEWVEPGKVSSRVRGDKNPHPIAFAAAADGARQTPDELHDAMTWLYFEPDLVMTLLRHRGAALSWYSSETGSLGATRYGLHFGVNALGLINIFAKDIGNFDAWEQRLWSAHNVTPEGGVSRELFAAQMEVRPADTAAPEAQIPDALAALDAAFAAKFGAPMLRENDAVPRLITRAHRFRAAESEGLLALSKDLTRLFAERVDVEAVAGAAGLKLGEKKPNSLKAIEMLLATLISETEARTMMAPLFGILDLRLADAHLGTSLIASGLERAGVDDAQPAAVQGCQLLQSFLGNLQAIAGALRHA